ncbi:MAG: hypothetical protein NTW29_06015 [Bacteroidetes bacterium]|nr:hypothetical protein [Bacteroidota bacterium]
MFAELYQYLLLHKELPLPGVGTCLLNKEPARVDFPNKMIHAPAYRFAWKAESHLPDKYFFQWLALQFGISDREAIFRFNDFSFDLKKQLTAGSTITWNGVGLLNRGLAGEIKFTPAQEAYAPESPAGAVKVIRDKAEHTVRVGESEKTAAEMVEMLNQPEGKKSFWWAWALALGILALVFLGWYFSEHGLELSSTGNTKIVVPDEAGPTYQALP